MEIIVDLTYHNKKLSALEKIEIQEHKDRLILMAGNRCTICHDYYPHYQLQLAHRISKAERNIKKFGYEVIHHEFNTPVTCAGCNSSVLISKPIPTQTLVNRILEDLNNI
jgi:hypothetical protein